MQTRLSALQPWGTVPDPGLWTLEIIGNSAFSSCSGLTSVTSIGSKWGGFLNGAFSGCTSLTSVTILNRATSIGEGAFSGCPGLRSVYFNGNAPSVESNVFDSLNVTVYYLPGTTGWGATWAGCPTALWRLPNPLILTPSPSLGLTIS